MQKVRRDQKTFPSLDQRAAYSLNRFAPREKFILAICNPPAAQRTRLAENFFAENLIAAQGARSIRTATGGQGGHATHMKIRKRPNFDLQAEWYHRLKLEALRAEGERLRHELRRRGLDPASILTELRERRGPQPQN